MDKPATLAVTIQKGGVGKTTTAINVAGALNERGREVLLIDLDPQGAATEGLGFAQAYDAAPPSLFDVLTDTSQRGRLADLIVEHDEMDVVPSNIDMTVVEPELTLARRGGEQLSLALEELHETYEYVIIDCPPYLGYLTDNALYAAQDILIPALAESTSKRAFELLFDHIESLALDYDIAFTERGVIANRVEQTNEATAMVEWFNDAFPDVPVWEIRKRVALQRAFAAGSSIFKYDPTLDMADQYRAIAASLDAQYGFTHGSGIEVKQ